MSVMFSAIIGIYAVFILLLLAYMLFAKIVECIYAYKTGAKYCGLVFVPFGYQYVLGQLAEMYTKKKAISKLMWSYALFCLGLIACCCAEFFIIYNSFVGDNISEGILTAYIIGSAVLLLFSIPYYIYTYICVYRIISYKTTSNNVLWLVLTILLGLPYVIFMLAYMNKPGASSDERSETEPAEIIEPAQY